MLQAIDQLPLTLVEATRARILAATHIKANHAISYADAFVVAAAQEFAATALTGDPEFARVE
ncbi:MAG TPA: PIN domain-containing protein, partial [Caldilineaceae bacterium]|nr:PIN domain-containing protein [Caldilineaceae bacterium]